MLPQPRDGLLKLTLSPCGWQRAATPKRSVSVSTERGVGSKQDAKPARAARTLCFLECLGRAESLGVEPALSAELFPCLCGQVVPQVSANAIARTSLLCRDDVQARQCLPQAALTVEHVSDLEGPQRSPGGRWARE